MIKVKITGLKNLEKNLKKLELKQAKNVLRASIRAGGRVVVKAARNNLPGNYIVLRKSLTVKVKRQRSPVFIVAQVGTTTGKNARYDGYYANMVEFGTDPHVIPRKRGSKSSKVNKILKFNDNVYRTSINHPGTPARPFLRPAFDNNIRQIEKAFAAKMWEGIKKVL